MSIKLVSLTLSRDELIDLVKIHAVNLIKDMLPDISGDDKGNKAAYEIAQEALSVLNRVQNIHILELIAVVHEKYPYIIDVLLRDNPDVEDILVYETFGIHQKEVLVTRKSW